MSPTTSIPVFPISAVIAVTFFDSDPAGCTPLPASLSFISCSGLRYDCAEIIRFPTLGSAFDPSRFDPSRYDTTQDRCMPSRPRFANPTGQPQMFVKPEPRMPPTTRLVTRQVSVNGTLMHTSLVARLWRISAKCALSNCLTQVVHSMRSVRNHVE